ncbi:MAG: hypothetical protein IJK60_02360 [Clostridia bacterium]|nr:hypothetical protein [Clostridia bacterium]
MNYDLLFSFLGSAAGCVAGIIASQRLTSFRLESLEKKVDKHNRLVERMAAAEAEIKSANKRIDALTGAR